MSFFLIADDSRFDGASRSLRTLVEPHGFTLQEPVRAGGWSLQVVDNPVRSAISRAEISPTTSLVAFGPFIYKGESDAAALKQFYRDFNADTFDWSGTNGHFCLVIIDNGTVRAFCDGLGAQKIYHDADRKIFSNSFLAVLSALDRPRLDALGAYEYVWSAACYGTRSFVDGLAALPANTLVTLDGGLSVDQKPSPIGNASGEPGGGLDFLLENNLLQLREAVAAIAKYAGGRICVSFSGGYDSRLLLALLLEQGTRPELFVYGSEGSGDVRVAQFIAEKEKLVLRHVDKSRFAPPAGAAAGDLADQAMVMFDGWKVDGLIDNGVDAHDRHTRHTDGFVPLNGGLGEIYRNFFSLPNRSFRASNVVDAFYRTYLGGWAGAAFDEDGYVADMAAAMAVQLGVAPDTRLGPRQAAMIYPLFRGRFWTARDAQTNQRFGPMCLPFLEHGCIRASGDVPLTARNFGRFQAALIRRVSPALASYPSEYGFAFDQPASLRYRLDNMLTILRPTSLRRHIWAIKRRRRQSFCPELATDRLATFMDTGFPYTRALFNAGEIGDEEAYNRLVSLEYLCQRFDFSP